MQRDVFRQYIGQVPDIKFRLESIAKAFELSDDPPQYYVIANSDPEYLDLAIIGYEYDYSERTREWYEQGHVICKKSDILKMDFYDPEDEEIPEDLLAQFKPSFVQ